MSGPYNSFLVINPYGIGDVLFSTPLLRNLHDAFPQARIFFLCNKKTAPILKSHPLISNVFAYERDEFAAAGKRSFWEGLKMYRNFIAEIKKEKIACSIDLSLNTLFGYFAWASGIRARFGLDYKNRGRFLTRKLKFEGFIDKHVAEYYLDVLTLLGIPVKKYGLEVGIRQESRKLADSFIEQHNLGGNFIIGIAPFGGDAFGKDAFFKRWPAEHFINLIDRLTEELKAKVFIFAGPKEKIEVSGIMNTVGNKGNCYEFTDASLEDTVALIDKCGLFIGNDTGPLRFADALNKKIVALFGPVPEDIYGPYPPNEKKIVMVKKGLACRPCYRNFRLSPCASNRECLSSIAVEDVMSAVRRLLP